MTNKETKKKCPAPTASTAGTCLFVVNFGNAPVPKVPRDLHQVNCFQEGMLEFEVPWGSVSADFRQFKVGGEGKRKKDTGLTRRVNPNSHISHLQAQ